MSNKRKRERQPRGKAFAGKRKKDTNDENWVWNGLVLTQRTLSIECPKDSIVFKSFLMSRVSKSYHLNRL